jgi:glycolate oxidase FAD binding subunit
MGSLSPQILRPATRNDLVEALRDLHRKQIPVQSVDLSHFSRVLEYTPEDMTVTVEAGLALGELQRRLARSGQWLPLDPPRSNTLTIGALLDSDASGPRRYGYGPPRDHLIGLRVVLADGRLVHSGGKVVKNVAGYDLMKLFVGARGSLGVIVEATFKLLPLPESEQFVQFRCESLPHAGKLLEAILKLEIAPVSLDLHNMKASLCLVLGFAGTKEDVNWQLQEVARLHSTETASLEHEEAFHGQQGTPSVQRVSVQPSQVIETLEKLGPVPFIARAGNGIIYHRGGPTPPTPALPLALIERVKSAFDPNRIFPELPL